MHCLLLGRASPHDPDTPPMNQRLRLSAGRSNHCPPALAADPFNPLEVTPRLTSSPPPHLLPVDDLHSDPHQHDEDLLSGPLSSFGSSAPSLECSPDPTQGLATPPVELLLSDHFYLIGAARVVADDVEEDKSFWS